MKFNKWTLGLAALGVVSLASAVKADEKAPTYLETAVSGTTISGYVNTSAHWDIGSGTSLPGYGLNSSTKADGFNVDAVKVSISKPLDETEWASGYTADVVYGSDFNNGNGSAFGPLKQAFVELRTPVGNGIDWKVGLVDTILGYEVFDAGSNPNYTHSYGYALENTDNTGIFASYKFADWISASAGVANTTQTTAADRSSKGESSKTYQGSVSLTAPNSWGVLAGSSLYAAVVKGTAASSSQDTVNYYVGGVFNTGVKGLKVGAAYDYQGLDNNGGNTAAWANALALYASFQATDKLSLHARGEYAWADQGATSPLGTGVYSVYALTGTVQYDLWKNVLSRLEVRWDHDKDNVYGQAASLKKDHVLLAANVIYKF